MCSKSLYLLVICLMLCFASGASADLVAHWAFDEGQGTIAYDSTGNGHDGTLRGDPQWVTGMFNGALEFDGDDDSVEVPDDEALHLWEKFTLSAWIYQMESRGSGMRIIDKCTAGTSDGPHMDTYPGRVIRSCSGSSCDSTTSEHTLNEWHHVVLTFDEGEKKIYVDGSLEGEATTSSPLAGNTITLTIGCDSNAANNFYGYIDDVAVFNHALTEAEVLAAMGGIGSAESAANPSPADGAIDVPRDIALTWEAGEFAVTHDVYLGTVFGDVNSASRSDDKGVLLSQGQTVLTYDPEGVFEYGETYYWRIDEVNGAPDNTIFKGETWSFTIEPLAYPVTNILATSNVEFQADAGPENTVNGSGLNDNDEHSTESTDMWQASPAAGEALTITYEFDGLYKLHEMLVWNYNVQFELLLGFGVKDAMIEYSENGTDWTVLGEVTLNQATAAATYTANTTIDFGGAAAQYVRLTVNSGFGGMGQFGLSEVRFLYIPVQAREPEPEDGAMDVAVETDLSWRAGREAVASEVYLGADADALELIDTVTTPTADAGALDLAATYYWRITEVNEAEAISDWAGPVWSFSTEAHLLVEDFESYDDDENRIYQAWVDGYGVDGNGSQVGHLESPFAEQTVVKGGAQSMPLFFDNTGGTALSEAERTLEVPMDWTIHGIQSLSLAFAGAADNTPGQLYVKINGAKVLYDGAAADLQISGWLAWAIDVSALGNVSNVTTLTIGIEGAGAQGVLYIDEIRLYPLEAEMIEPVEPGTADLVAHYPLDADFQDSTGNGNHAAPVGDAAIVADAIQGGVVSLDGLGDTVQIPPLAGGTAAEATIAMWMNTDIAWTSGLLSLFHSDGWTAGDIHMHISSGGYFTAGINGMGSNLQSATMPVADEWYQVAVSVSAEHMGLYVNGVEEDARTPETVPESLILGEGHLGAWLNSGSLQRHLTGQIDDVRFYSRALSYGEILGLAGRTMPLYRPF